MAPTRFQPRRVRLIARAVHLAVAVGLIAVSACAPIISAGLASLLSLTVAAPLLGLTGLVMWRPAVLAKALARRAGRPAR